MLITPEIPGLFAAVKEVYIFFISNKPGSKP
jgi:hypothetical protein